MSLHSFDPLIAAQVGLNAAAIHQNFLFWSQKNKANRKHIRDGYVWTYNSRRALSELFPYLSERQIRTGIEKLLEAGLLIKGEYNNASYDRTCWYALSVSAEWVCTIGQKCPMERTEMSNRLDQKVQPIPDSKPDDKPDGKHLSVKTDNRTDLKEPDQFEEFWGRYPRKVAKKRAKAAYVKALKSHEHDDIIFGLSQHLPSLEAKEPRFVPHAATWLNDERFADEPENPTSNQSLSFGHGGRSDPHAMQMAAFAAAAARGRPNA
ncbi:MAG: hypothetical protein ACSHXW_02370 [Yoonia sp.]